MALVLHCQFYGSFLKVIICDEKRLRGSLMCCMYTCTCLIFQRYTKQSLKRSSMKWTMHMCLLQPRFKNLDTKKSTKCKTLLHCQQLTKTAVFDFFFFRSVKQIMFLLRYFSVPWLILGVCTHEKWASKHNLLLNWQFCVNSALSMFGLVDFRFSLYYLFDSLGI